MTRHNILRWVSLSLVAVCSVQGQQLCNAACQSAQQQALSALYTATGGPDWVPTATLAHQPAGWLNTSVTVKGLPGHCYWSGVYCCVPTGYPAGLPQLIIDVYARNYYPSYTLVNCTMALGIAALSISHINMTGRLDGLNLTALAPSLTTLDLGGNNLSGMLTPLSQLKKLKYLDVNGNQLTGPLDTWLPALTALEFIDLSINDFSGKFPCLKNITQLRSVSAGLNRLTGALPTEWLALPEIREIDLAYNSISGSIPAVGVGPPGVNSTKYPYLGYGGDLYSSFYVGTAIRLQYNRLTGPMPVTLILSHVLEFDASWNNLTNNVKDILLLTYAKRTKLSGNNIYGTLPPLTNFIAAYELLFDYTNLSGTYPDFYGPRCQKVPASGQEFTGPLSDHVYFPQLTEFQARNTTLRSTKYNSRGELLPEWLQYDYNKSIAMNLQLVSAADVTNLRCLPIVGVEDASPYLTDVSVDAAYYQFQFCECLPGLEKAPADPVNGLSRIQCKHVWHLNVPGLIGFILGLGCFVAITTWLCLLARRFRRRMGPPGKGRPLTLVLTDVEGSAELWVWDSAAMAEARKIHDAILRTLLKQFNGYEVSNRADSFCIAFHAPADAVGWCLNVQRLLMSAAWPSALEEQALTAPICKSSRPGTSFKPHVRLLEGDRSSSHKLDPGVVLLRGLRVRMGVATGISEGRKADSTKRTYDYTGLVAQHCKAIMHAANGGQIICNSATLAGIRCQLPELYKGSAGASSKPAVPQIPEHQPSLASVVDAAWEEPSPRPGIALQQAQSNIAVEVEAEVEGDEDEGEAPVPSPGKGHVRKRSIFGRSMSGQSPATPTEAPAGFRTSGLQGTAVIQQTLGFLDMGAMLCQASPDEPASVRSLIQLLVPGLEQRAWYLPALKGLPVSPGYFDAPAASACPWGQKNSASLPRVCIVFCAVDGHAAQKASKSPAYEAAMNHYRDCIRSNILRFQGYECQENESEFMLAFSSSVKAATFCLKAQEALLDVVWGLDEQALPGCAAGLGDMGQLLWRGPRVRMGMWEGQPVATMPHPASGRCDYFGILCNRAARLCHAVAHGGQIAVPLDIAQRFAEHCTGTPAAFTEDSLTSTAPPVSKSLPPASLLDMSLPGIVEAASGELHYPDGSNGSKEGAEFAAVPVRGERGSRVSRVSRLSGSQKHSGGLGLRGSEAEGLLQEGGVAAPSLAPGRSLTYVQSCKYRPSAGGGAARRTSGTGARRTTLTAYQGPALSGGASSDDLRSMVDILHSGAVTLKGVARPVTVMFLLPMMLSGRAFPSGLPGKAKPSKAKLVAPSRGLQCSVRLPPDT